jgi:hypothetical protein
MEYKTNYKKVNVFKAFLVAAFAVATILGTNSALAAGPQMLTLPPTGVTQTSITLQGNFTGGTGTTQVRFDYGTTPLVGTFTPYQTFTGTNSSFTETLTGLTPGTNYYIRAEGINGGGPGFGSVVNVTTLSYQTATVHTLPVTNPSTDIGATTAIVNGWYQSAAPTTVSIEYANNSSFVGSYTSSSISEPAGNGSFPITLTGLAPNTTYYYRAVATTNGGTTTANSAFSFTTTSSGGTTGGTTGGSTGGTSGGTTGGTSGGTSGGSTGYSQPCVISYFTTSASSITTGATVTLSWSTSNCTSVYLNGPGVSGSQSTSGQITVTPTTGSNTYTLTASGNGSNPSTSLTVNATSSYWGGNGNSNCYISSFYASPAQVTLGSGTTIYWNTQNCTSASVTGNNMYQQQQSTSGSVFVSNLYNTSTYTLTAYGLSGTQVQTLTVAVTSTPIVGPVVPYTPPTTPTTIIRYITGTGTQTQTRGTGSLVLGSTVESGQGSYASNGSNLAGLALFGSNFLPTSLLSLLIIALIIMGIILIARRIYGTDQGHGAPQAAHH